MVDDREMILEESVTSLYNLRGTADADLSSTVAMNKYYVYEETSRFLQNSNSSSSGITTANSDNQSFAIMLAVLVTLILLFFVVCTYQVLRNWLCKLCCGRDLRRSNNTATPLTDADTVLVHDGRVFNLTGDQRRAVLEAIFSETSKAVTDQDVSAEKKKKKQRRRKQSSNNDDSDENDDINDIPMDAVEIPRVSSIGTETSNTDHHGNLAPTDDYGDFKSTSGNAADSPAATSHNSSSSSEPLSSSPSSPTLRRIRTYSVESCPSPATAVPPNDDSDLESDEDHDCSQSRCPSPDGTFSNGDIRSLDGQLDLDVDDTDANALVFAMGTPVAANLKKEDDSECQGESKYSMTTGHLTPNLSRRGAASLKGLDTIGEGGSLESPLGVLVSSAAENSPVILAHREVQSTCNISDDEASDDEKKNIVRNALFRENAGSSKTARRGEYTDESKEEIDNQIDFPVIELSASHESSGDYYCDYITPSSLRVPVPMTRRESFATVTSEYTFDDDSTTGDNVCPICLCGYKKGDVLVVSQHCTHCFHKDCILEWLEKHDNCPICRINMVTDSEMSRAATSLVGKTRMYRAVASMQSPHSHGAAPNRRNQTNHSSSSNAVSPFAGTMGRAARTRTPGGY